ncbi:MAG: NADH-ubiquinone oxidoreductase-F iron-sulfur binding region domain-containing protein [Planctomycetota bacterium]|jgi:NADH:ubiquinone oxidoreductase subunit F (NADH-binding)
MQRKGARRDLVIQKLEGQGGLAPGLADRVSGQTGVPAADVYGVGTFYTLLSKPGVRRVCQGLSCRLAGGGDIPKAGISAGDQAVSCLGQCDRAPASLGANLELEAGRGRGDVLPDDPELPLNLGGADDPSYAALEEARKMGAAGVLAELKASGLQGRGGAGFPAHVKWEAVRGQSEATRYVVVNADEGEPGTFKDREVILRHPHQLLEGAAIAAEVVGAGSVYIYIRGEFVEARRLLERAIQEAAEPLSGLEIHVVAGHGAYICGEETALLEALEGRRGMPRLKPPFPTESGLWGKPTVVNNVETLACVPDIVRRGGARFRDLGRKEPGIKLYCVSGHVARPGVYELPLGITLDELVETAGGYVGTPRAFSPGGASSGFLPMGERDRPLDFRSLQEAGAMLGSAGVVVLNVSVNMRDAARWQQIFFEDETCGQCAPCRIGCRVQRRALDRYIQGDDITGLAHAEEVHWEMEEGSICGLGMVASLPLVSAMRYFPEDFS